MKKCILFAFGFLVLFSSKIAFAQVQEGIMAQVMKEHYICIGYKPYGQPLLFSIRTNRPDLFFDDILKIQKCFQEVKRIVERPTKKDLVSMNVYFTETVDPTALYGYVSNGIMNCREWRTDEGVPYKLEFTFPYIYQKEVKSVLHENMLHMCLRSVKKLTPAQIQSSI